MDLPKLTVRYGELDELQGPPRKWKGITIAAALVRLKGRWLSRSHTLAEHVGMRNISPIVRPMLLNGDDAPWVRGRVERLFLAPSVGEEDRIEKSAIEVGFVASVPRSDGTLVGVPFFCNDYYLRTGLTFSEDLDPPPKELADRVAEAFWELLLREPNDLHEYQDFMYHSGAGVWIVFGVQSGRPFFTEQKEEPAFRNAKP